MSFHWLGRVILCITSFRCWWRRKSKIKTRYQKNIDFKNEIVIKDHFLIGNFDGFLINGNNGNKLGKSWGATSSISSSSKNFFFQVCASVLSFLSLFNELTFIYERNGVYMRRLDRSSKQKENY